MVSAFVSEDFRMAGSHRIGYRRIRSRNEEEEKREKKREKKRETEIVDRRCGKRFERSERVERTRRSKILVLIVS